MAVSAPKAERTKKSKDQIGMDHQMSSSSVASVEPDVMISISEKCLWMLETDVQVPRPDDVFHDMMTTYIIDA